MVLVKNVKFLFSFRLGTFLLEKVFSDVLYRKLAFFDHKNIDLKKSQNLNFSKLVSRWFWSKIAYCFNFSFQSNLVYKHCLAAFQIENEPFPLKYPFKEVAKVAFFKSGPSLVFVKNLKILFFFLLGTFLQQKVFGDFLYRKLAFLKAVSPWFWSKL